MKNIWKNLSNFLVLGLICVLIVGCVTAEQVREIVASSNAAMVSSSLEAPGNNASGTWQEPVAQLDQLIIQNSNQPTLVNHLRVRQAMLLTVHQQDNLAKARWNQVEASVLKTERDRGLYENWEILVWWYKRAPDNNPFSINEKSAATTFVSKLDNSLNLYSDPELRYYLGITRVQMSLRLLNDADVSTPTKQQQVIAQMVNTLESYIGLFSEEDISWLNSTDRVDLSDTSEIADFRRRNSLNNVVMQYCRLPNRLTLSSPQWKPDCFYWD